MFDKKNVDSLEGLLKSLSTMKNPEWSMAQWMQFVEKSKNCVELINQLRDMDRFKEKAKENSGKKEKDNGKSK